jgi:hypothetical protein
MWGIILFDIVTPLVTCEMRVMLAREVVQIHCTVEVGDQSQQMSLRECERQVKV